MLFVTIALLAFVALQFADAISTYLVARTDVTQLTPITQWLVSKFGPAFPLIVTKVLIVGVAIALYFFLAIPWWIYAIACAVYLWKSGRALIIWKNVKSEIAQKQETQASS